MNFRSLVRAFAVLAVVPALALPGCLKEDDTVTLKKDGSGTFSQTATLDKGQLEQLKAFVKMIGGSVMQGGPAKEGGDDPGADIEFKIEDIFAPADLKARLKDVEGVELKKAETSDKDALWAGLKENIRTDIKKAGK